MAEVGKNIKKIRKEENLTQDDLAERLHCTRQTISNYENGKSEPNIALLVEIATDLWSEKEGEQEKPEDQVGGGDCGGMCAAYGNRDSYSVREAVWVGKV